MNNNELWKPIKNYEGLYEISNLGRLKSLGTFRHKGKIKSIRQDKDGYLIATLHKQCKQQTVKIHRLVAEAFIPNPNKLPQVNHKDENKQNNCVDNLEWCTQQYNMSYGSFRSKVAEGHKKAIIQLTLDNKFIKRWASAKDASQQLNLHATAITACCKGKSYKTGGFRWKYEKKEVEVK